MNNIGFIIFIVGMGVCIALSNFFTYQVTKYQFNHDQLYNSCGIFNGYQEINESRSGKIELITTYMNIDSGTEGGYRFMYHSRLHKNISYFKKIKKGEKVCFEYIKPYFKNKYGENFIKFIQLRG